MELPKPNRAERRRIQKQLGSPIPEVLDVEKPGWDRRLLDVIDKVYVDDVLIEQCVAYSRREGWARPKGGERVYGMVEITRKTA